MQKLTKLLSSLCVPADLSCGEDERVPQVIISAEFGAV